MNTVIPLKKYRGKRGLGRASLRLLGRASEITQAHGPISVRGVAYKLFIAGESPSMAKGAVDKVGRILVYGREHSIVDWDDIVDETRQIERAAMWNNLTDFAAAIESPFRRDFWTTQAYNVQVWSEKATVGGILRPVTEQFGVPFMAVHGFGSATSVHDAAIASVKDSRRELVILYCGDYDPSGMFMSEKDLPERLARYGGTATIRRITLIEEDLPGLPSFAAKQSDPRYKWYRSRFGEKAWELDALDPNVLRQRVEAAIRGHIDWPAWERMRLVEAAQQATVQKVARALAG